MNSTSSYHACLFQSLKGLAAEDPGEARARLRGVRGYLVQLPLRFLEKEDLRPPLLSSENLVSDLVFTWVSARSVLEWRIRHVEPGTRSWAWEERMWPQEQIRIFVWLVYLPRFKQSRLILLKEVSSVNVNEIRSKLMEGKKRKTTTKKTTFSTKTLRVVGSLFLCPSINYLREFLILNLIKSSFSAICY